MNKNFIFASESVGEGHPDKVCDAISDQVLDACLAYDKSSRVACECYAKSNLVVVGGEITIPRLGVRPPSDVIDFTGITRRTIREIGYAHEGEVFHADRVFVNCCITGQSRDIGQGVDSAAAEGKETAEQGAGDQGLMFGYACDETPELMPAPIMFAHRLSRELARRRKELGPDGKPGIPWLRPDAKSQVAVEYLEGKPTHIANVVISTQHTEHVDSATLRAFCIDEIIRKVLPHELLSERTKYLINPTGRFVVGGPEGDTGLTGRKIIVDSYGGMGRHGGGAFSGKDPSKVDRSAAYMGRYVAKNIVAAGLASRCEIQFAYAIGYPNPVSLSVDTFGTSIVGDERLKEVVQEVFSFKPADIVRQLDLLRPIYAKTTHYGHFGKTDPDLTWERVDKVEELRRALC